MLRQLEYLEQLGAEHQTAIPKTNNIINRDLRAVNEVLGRHNLPTLLASEVSS